MLKRIFNQVRRYLFGDLYQCVDDTSKKVVWQRWMTRKEVISMSGALRQSSAPYFLAKVEFSPYR